MGTQKVSLNSPTRIIGVNLAEVVIHTDKAASLPKYYVFRLRPNAAICCGKLRRISVAKFTRRSYA